MNHTHRGRGTRRWAVAIGVSASLAASTLLAGRAEAVVKPAGAAVLTASPALGAPGTLAHLSGSGFDAGETLQLKFDASDAGYALADASGTLTAVALGIPATASPRVHTISAIGPAGQPSAQATFTVTSPWTQGGLDARRDSANVFENYLTSDTVASLDRAWTGVIPDRSLAGAAVAKNLAIIGDESGQVTAFRIRCGVAAAACPPRWTATTGGAIQSMPAISGSRVYVTSNDGTVTAFPTSCHGTCKPVWVATTTAGAVLGSPAVVGSRVYVPSSDHLLYVFPTACAETCTPSWTADLGYRVLGVAVGAGHVFARTQKGIVSLDAAGCGAASCTAQWSADALGVAASPNPLIANGTVYVGTGSELLGYPVNCGTAGAICSPTFSADTGMSHTTGLAYAAGRLLVSDISGMLAAFSTSCTAPCLPMWHTQVGDGLQTGAQQPVVAGDLVYLSTPEGIGAYRLNCDPGFCTPTWQSPAGQQTYGTSESDGTLYTQIDETDGTHLLVALTPNGQFIPA